MTDRLADYDYELPPERIARRPRRRGESRLLQLAADGGIVHGTFRDLPRLLHAGDLLVLNDTRVLPARLRGHRLHADGAPGGAVEALLVERVATDGQGETWSALLRPGRRLGPGRRLRFGALEALVAGRSDDLFELRFAEPVEPALEEQGEIPLPPYLRRAADERDRIDYQTVYARSPGAVAAPTAGLHFDEALLRDIESRGVEVARVTLHVGPGTFRPVTADDIRHHLMDAERYELSAEAAAAIEAARGRGGRVVAVGTTVVRTLESVALDGGRVDPGAGRTSLFIRPGHTFRVVDALLTNFHLPRSTLLMLVAAFAGRERVLAAYREAVQENYRFYSYGDAMFIAAPARQDLRAAT